MKKTGKNFPVYLTGIGTAVPSHFIDQKAAARAAGRYSQLQMKKVSALYELTRIKKRGAVVLEKSGDGVSPASNFFGNRRNGNGLGPDTAERMKWYVENASGLALQACRIAMQKSGSHPQEIGQIVTVSCTGFSAPGVDVDLIKQLGLSLGTGRTHIGFMGCQGALNALRTGAAYVRSEPDKKILLCCVELCSIHFSYEERYDHVFSNALFADGASAAVLASNPSPVTAWRLSRNGSCIFPQSEEMMQWHIGNHGFSMRLSNKVPGYLSKNLRPWLEEWLEEAGGLKLTGIRTWAIHPGGPRILDELERGLNLAPNALNFSRKVLEDYGNMSSATLFFILERLLEAQAPLPCVALAFGPGLTAEATIFD